ncbi:MAG: hypothetical protein JW867_08425 [Candidatus Omnitrophica bacterium]|nr:hypothetical protein [Candidatus Omnitrophota bacterium]
MIFAALILALFFNFSFFSYSQDKKETLGEAMVRLSHTFRPQSGPGDFDFVITHDGIFRRYNVHVPKQYTRYDKSRALPALLVFHGGGGNAQSSIEFFSLNEKADKEGFMVVYPEGTGKLIRGLAMGSWNAGECCPPASDDKIDDVGFINGLINKLLDDFNIDPKRIYAAGHSNGALMVYRLACELPDKIAAIAACSAHDAFPQCRPYHGVPVLHIHGTADSCAPYEGGECGGCFARFLSLSGIGLRNVNWKCSSVEDYVFFWKKLNYCSDDQAVIYENKNARCISYNDCLNESEVVLCTVEGMGHYWPGEISSMGACKSDADSELCFKWLKVMGKPNSDLIANDIIWDFFKRHTLTWSE